MIKFSQLTDTQKQSIASHYWDNVAQARCCTSEVNFILGAAAQGNDEAPFCEEDITNNEAMGEIEINGKWLELTQEETDDKINTWESLVCKTESSLSNLEEKEGLLDTNSYERLESILERALERRQSVLDSLNELDMVYPEVYMWFCVSDYTARCLDKEGQCVISNKYWGRQGYGQSVVLDIVIQTIAFNHYCEYRETAITHEKLVEIGAAK